MACFCSQDVKAARWSFNSAKGVSGEAFEWRAAASCTAAPQIVIEF